MSSTQRLPSRHCGPTKRPRHRRGAALALGALTATLFPVVAHSTVAEARGAVLPAVFTMGQDGPEALNTAVLRLPLVTLGGPGQVSPAFSGGGCTSNATCNNLVIRDSRTDYIQRNADHFLHGATTYSWMAPTQPTEDGFNYDFGDTLTNVTSDGDSICIVKNIHGSDQAASNPISYWPTGHRSTGNSGTERLGVSAGSASYQATFNVSEGYLDGNIWGSDQTPPHFAGSWGYADATQDQAPSVCNLRGASMESGIAFRTSQASAHPRLGFSTVIYYQQNA